jgi:DNA polymerase IV
MIDHRAILHVDMDAFFASVEAHDDPSLADKPVIVGGTGGRGVVAAASYEARRFGIHSAMPLREALRRCPHVVCVRPRMKRYKEVSQQVFAVFGEFTDQVEGLSLDEAFLDVTASRELFGTPVEMAREIKRRIFERTGLTASVGVAHNKLLAKLASEMNKPDGLTVIGPDDVEAVLDPLPIRRMHGIGNKTAARVEEQGLYTLGQLRRAPESVLWPLFGRDTRRIRERAAGIDDRPVVVDAAERQISSEETFEEDIRDHGRLCAALAVLADRTAARLRARELKAGLVIVKIRRRDFTTFTRQRSFSRGSPCACSVSASAAWRRHGNWTCSRPPRTLEAAGSIRRSMASARNLAKGPSGAAARSIEARRRRRPALPPPARRSPSRHDENLACSFALRGGRHRFLDFSDVVGRCDGCVQLALGDQPGNLPEERTPRLLRCLLEPSREPEATHRQVAKDEGGGFDHAGLAAHPTVVDQGRPLGQAVGKPAGRRPPDRIDAEADLRLAGRLCDPLRQVVTVDQDDVAARLAHDRRRFLAPDHVHGPVAALFRELHQVQANR